jgi:hypothetical protein
VHSAVVEDLAVEAGRQRVEPGVHPAAPGERLEAQPVPAAGDHRVERAGARPVGRLVVAAAGHLRDGEQAGRGRGRRGEEAGEEPGVGRRPAAGLQRQPGPPQFGRREVPVGLNRAHATDGIERPAPRLP